MTLVQDTILYAAELTGNGQVGVEGELEYQRAIDRMARSTLGTFRSTLQGILLAESGLAPARTLLDYRQARFSQRLYARPRDGQGPEEILSTREEAALTTRLSAAAGSRPEETIEAQGRSRGRHFPGRVCIDEKGLALETVQNWGHRDTIWAASSRPDSRAVGVARA